MVAQNSLTLDDDYGGREEGVKGTISCRWDETGGGSGYFNGGGYCYVKPLNSIQFLALTKCLVSVNRFRVNSLNRAPKVTEVVLKMHLHCEGCAKDVKRCIHKMEGVHTVNPDMDKSLVTVKGAFDPKNLVAYINKKLGRHAEVVNTKNTNKNQKDGEQKEEHEKGEKGEKKDKNAGSVYPNVPPGLVYAPQLFSDENPNACSIM
ncbi:hypothetical protein M8C21_028221 [Ambrosia artemisiifolia]|uniref:HMA domain-containing protein n=1 Tax=Ambrosia artemisiifolia TaxID=4212 RepID=A0AAD5CZ00_AMBAR|nr:hypothetical protein M8C21_028221 [Ambrosia artemisiifolia]